MIMSYNHENSKRTTYSSGNRNIPIPDEADYDGFLPKFRKSNEEVTRTK